MNSDEFKQFKDVNLEKSAFQQAFSKLSNLIKQSADRADVRVINFFIENDIDRIFWAKVNYSLFRVNDHVNYDYSKKRLESSIGIAKASSSRLIDENEHGELKLSENFTKLIRFLIFNFTIGKLIFISEVIDEEKLERLLRIDCISEKDIKLLTNFFCNYIVIIAKSKQVPKIKRIIKQVVREFRLPEYSHQTTEFVKVIYEILNSKELLQSVISKVEDLEDVNLIFKYIEESEDSIDSKLHNTLPFILVQITKGNIEIASTILRIICREKLNRVSIKSIVNLFDRIRSFEHTTDTELWVVYKNFMREFCDLYLNDASISHLLHDFRFIKKNSSESEGQFIRLIKLLKVVGLDYYADSIKKVVLEESQKTLFTNADNLLGAITLMEDYENDTNSFLNTYVVGHLKNISNKLSHTSFTNSIEIFVEGFWDTIDPTEFLDRFAIFSDLLEMNRKKIIDKYCENQQFEKFVPIINSKYYNEEIGSQMINGIKNYYGRNRLKKFTF